MMKLTLKTTLYSTALFLLLTTHAFAQTKVDQEKLKAKTDQKALDSLKSTTKTCPKSERRLKRQAKKLNISYRIVEKNGTISQLVDIEKNGTPVYISTDENSTPNTTNTEELPVEDIVNKK